ncbi:hypothetical protein OAT18_03410 [Tenacibaculum sp.]|nr:hypothetical protein [Tenacibaculum sp.]
MDITKKHSVIALGYFMVIAALGVLLRCFSTVFINFNYKYIVHTHSHVALLGWVYTALMLLIYQLYLKNVGITKKYKSVFWFTQITIIGMLISFPFTGYALFSILFSTLFLIASYFFSYLVFKYVPEDLKRTNSYKCTRLSLWYMIISSIGPWALGVIMNIEGEDSSWYRNAIYFYLHFQYNGWFILALFGVLFRILEQYNIPISNKIFKQFFTLFNWGVVLTFLISVLWMQIHDVINIAAGLGSLFQIMSFIILLKEIIKEKERIKFVFSSLLMFVFKVIIVIFFIKLLMQFFGTFSYFSNVISFNMDFVISYIHWVFLGVVSLSLLTFMKFLKLISMSKRSVVLYLLAFVITEISLIYRAFSSWGEFETFKGFNYFLLFGSVLFLIRIGLMFKTTL